MKKFVRTRQLTIVITCVSVAWPQMAAAVAPTTQSADVLADRSSIARDVTLRNGGVLVGRLLLGDGVPRAGRLVSVLSNNKEIAQAITDQRGVFTVRGLRGGVYQIHSGASFQLVRLWAPRTAPPAATDALTLSVVEGQVVRGQCGPGTCCPPSGAPPCGSYAPPSCGGGLQAFLCNPWVIAGVVAAAIAIPVALHNNSDNDSGS